MTRGGARKGAGKKTTWKSGCRFEDTKLIRVPKKIANRILELAHDLDEGRDYELVTKSLKEENQRLKEKLASEQLEIDFQPQPDYLKLRDEALNLLRIGEQSKTYQKCKKAFNYFISKL